MKRLALGFLVLLVAGCGGGGASVSQQAQVKFDLAWAARSRTLHAPSSALSMKLVLPKALPGNTDLEVRVNRHSDPAAYTQSVTASQSANTGSYPMTATFYAGSDATGDVVGNASAQVTIRGDGSGIGEIATEGTVATVDVVAATAIQAPAIQQLQFSAKDAQSHILALSPGSGSWTQVDGSTALSLTTDGVATGIQDGFSNVRVTVDGIQSQPYRVVVNNNPDGAPAVLNFDSLPSVSVLAGTTVTSDAQLSDRYLNTLGIRFSSGAPYVAVCQMQPDAAPTPPNSISSVTAAGVVWYSPDVALTFTFFDPKDTTVPAGTKSFSATTDLIGIPSHTTTMTAYDVNGNVLTTDSHADTGGVVHTVSDSLGRIHKVVFIGSPNEFDGVSLDNVTFSPVVPVN